MASKKPNPYIGSDFEDFLREEGRLRVSTVMAVNRVTAWRECSRKKPAHSLPKKPFATGPT